MLSTRMLVGGAVGLAVAGGLVWALWPEPVPVDMATAERGAMRVTVAAEGVARVRDPYLVTAPVSGNAIRSPVEVGDTVLRGDSIVAVIQPADPGFLDARARREAEAAVREAKASVDVAEARLDSAEEELSHANAELARNQALAARGAVPQRVLDDSRQAVESRRAALRAAQSELARAEAGLARAEAQLTEPGGVLSAPEPGACCAEVAAPQSGTVLSIEEPSARLVQAGAPLLTIGDLNDLELEAELLTSDALRLAPGARATVTRWGGDTPLEAELRRVDPAAFTKVSALGIEEQRVRVRLDLTTPAAERPPLGDAYRVFLEISEWESDDALQVPISALFRSGGDWAVFTVEDGTARERRIGIGRRTDTHAEVTEGLEEGDVVVAYPGGRISDGTRVAARGD